MRSMLVSLLLLATLPAFARDLPNPRPVQVTIDIDANGRVTDSRMNDELPEATAVRLLQRISSFEFTPAMRNGHAVPCSTTLWLEFAFEAVDEKQVAIRIRDAYTGPGWADQKAPMRYPPEALRARREGDVRLRLQYDGEGRVTEATVLESKGDKLFGKAAQQIAVQWRLMPERVDGQAVAGSVDVPMSFRITNGRPPKLPESRVFDNATTAATPAADRELVAESEVSLRTEVAGTLL